MMTDHEFTCPLCGSVGIASLIMPGNPSVWEAECCNSSCNGSEPTEIMSDDGGEFPVDEWSENYDMF